MFMDTLINTRDLLKVKARMHRNSFNGLLAVMTLIFITNLSITAAGIFTADEGIHFYPVNDFSVSFFWGAAIALIIVEFMYRSINNRLSVFPQTNGSRFLSSQIWNYIIMFNIGLAVLVIYLLYYGAIRLLAVFKPGVYLALPFDAGYAAAGFIAFIAYGFLAASVIALIGAVIRKWTYYAAAFFAAFTALILFNTDQVTVLAPKLFAFIIGEPSFGLFLLKAFALWAVIFALSFIINRRTVYYKSQNPGKKRAVVFACIIIAVISAVVVPVTVLLVVSVRDNGAPAQMTDTHSADDFLWDFYESAAETRIDISHLPKGSDINLTVSGAEVIGGGRAAVTGSRGRMAYVSGTDALSGIVGDTLVIKYSPPYYTINNSKTHIYDGARMSAHLENGTLYIDYITDGAHIVILPVWGIAGQFGFAGGKGYVTDYILGVNTRMSVTANIYIAAE